MLPVDEAGDIEAAFGHPHSYTVPRGVGPLWYSGSEVWFCVARHERMWKGESMEISK